MIIKKLGVLLLAVILGLTLAGTPALYANNINNDTCPPGTTYNNTNYKYTDINPIFSTDPISYGLIEYNGELHIKQDRTIFCDIVLMCLKEGRWKILTAGFTGLHRYPVYVYIYKNEQKVWEKKTNTNAIFGFKLPYLSKGNYTMLFVYHGSQKHKLLPCNKTVPLYVE